MGNVPSLFRVALGQRGAFPKDALDFSSVLRELCHQRGLEYQLRGKKLLVSLSEAEGEKNLLVRTVRLRSLEIC